MDFFPWCHDQTDDSLAWITDRPEALGDEGWQLSEGTPCASWFPKDLTFDLSKRHGVKLSDSIPNTLGVLVVSEKLKKMIEEQAPKARIEFLPVRIRDKKKKVVAARFFVANVLDTVPCVDMKKSDYEMDAIDKEQVDYFRRLVLDLRKIPKGMKLFRLAEERRLVLARRDMAQPIVNADCSGMRFVMIDEYGMEFR